MRAGAGGELRDGDAARLVDEALEDTFPASDPPFFVGGIAEHAGAPEEDAEAERERHPAKHGQG